MTSMVVKGLIAGGVLIGAAILSVSGKNGEKEITARLLVKVKTDLINLFQHCNLSIAGLEQLFSSESCADIVLAEAVKNIACSFVPVNDKIEMRLSVQYHEGTAFKRSVSKRVVPWEDLPPSLADQVLKSGIDGANFQLYSKNDINNC